MKHMAKCDVRRSIENGVGFWNHETRELVFFQAGYDDEDNTYTIGMACWDKDLGVQADNIRHDRAIDRDDAVKRIVGEYGWLAENDPLTRVYGPMVLSAYEEE